MGATARGVRCIATCAALVACVAASAVDLPATYRLAGSARVSAPPAPDRAAEVHADATLRAGSGGVIVVTLGAQGATCDVRARAGARGALSFEAGQRCAIDLRSPDARGHLDVVLRSGAGHVDAEELTLDLSLDVDGAMALRTASRVDVLGRDVDLPSTWLPEAPVRGHAHATATGRRDRSRAAPAR